MELEDMGINSLPVGGIHEVSFGYPSDLYGYATLMPDMMKLSDIMGLESF